MSKITASEARNITRGCSSVNDMLDLVYTRIRQAAEAGNWFLYPYQQVPKFSSMQNAEKHELLGLLMEDGYEVENPYHSDCCIKW